MTVHSLRSLLGTQENYITRFQRQRPDNLIACTKSNLLKVPLPPDSTTPNTELPTHAPLGVNCTQTTAPMTGLPSGNNLLTAPRPLVSPLYLLSVPQPAGHSLESSLEPL